jgi:hypothetical protein
MRFAAPGRSSQELYLTTCCSSHFVSPSLAFRFLDMSSAKRKNRGAVAGNHFHVSAFFSRVNQNNYPSSLAFYSVELNMVELLWLCLKNFEMEIF